MSSAKRNMSDFMFSSISLRYTRKKRDDSIDPCVTEPNIFKNSDDFPFKTTLWDLPDRYFHGWPSAVEKADAYKYFVRSSSDDHVS